MIPTTASKISGTIGILVLLITTIFISSTAAQSQYCECYDAAKTVSVRRAPVRRVAYRAKARRSYRRTARVRTVYRTVYVPTTTRVASYVGYADKSDCDQAYVPASRVVVTEPVYSARYYGSAYNTEVIARGWGQRDGFKDGWKAALKNRMYDPENNGDYRDANNGYKRRFGSKYLYKTAYRDGYVRGYDSGFASIAGGTYGMKY